MSNFNCKVKIKSTGEIKDVYAQDDFFGKNKYGYSDGDKTYHEEEVELILDTPDSSWDKLYKARNKILDLSRDDGRLTLDDWTEEYGHKTLGDCIDDVLLSLLKEQERRIREEARQELFEAFHFAWNGGYDSKGREKGKYYGKIKK